MRYVIYIWMLTFGIILSYGQNICIEKDVELLPTNIYASKNLKVDENGNPCAVLFVQSSINDLNFEGDVVGDVVKDGTTYLVYVKGNTNKLRITHPQYFPVNIKFPVMQPKHTYEVIVGFKTGKGSLILKTDPSGADVSIQRGDEKINLGKSPLKGNLKIIEGTYELHISKQGYMSTTKTIKIEKDKTKKLGTIKLKKLK